MCQNHTNSSFWEWFWFGLSVYRDGFGVWSLLWLIHEALLSRWYASEMPLANHGALGIVLGLTTTTCPWPCQCHIASMKQLLLRMWMPSARPHSQLAAWPMGCSTNVAPCAKQCTTIEPLWFRRCWAQKRVLIQMEDWNGKFASTNCDHLECLADS